MKSIQSTIASSVVATCFIMSAGAAAAQPVPGDAPAVLKAEVSCATLQWTARSFESNHAPYWAVEKIKAQMAAIDCEYF